MGRRFDFSQANRRRLYTRFIIPTFDSCSGQADGPGPLAAHGLVLSEDMLHGGAHLRTLAVGLPGPSRKRRLRWALR